MYTGSTRNNVESKLYIPKPNIEIYRQSFRNIILFRHRALSPTHNIMSSSPFTWEYSHIALPLLSCQHALSPTHKIILSSCLKSDI